MTAYDLAQRFIGEIRELPGKAEHPYIQWAHSLCGLGNDVPDEVAWCSSFVNAIAWTLRLPRSKSAAARSWLSVGIPIGTLSEAKVGYDVVILNRAGGPQDATKSGPGHVGFFAGVENGPVPMMEGVEVGPVLIAPKYVLLLAGNQGNTVSVAHYPISQILGIRRLKS
jgi:hypothetical protein